MSCDGPSGTLNCGHGKAVGCVSWLLRLALPSWFFFLSFPFHHLVAEDFEDRDFRAIAYADAGVDDARVAAGPVRKLWRNLAEVLRWWRT
jgi:hypothetical protein